MLNRWDGLVPMSRPRRRRVNATGRNEGIEPYAVFTYEMITSPAWRSLSGAAVKVWLEIRCQFRGRNNGELALGM